MPGKLVAVETAVLVCNQGSSQAPLLATCRTAKFGGQWAANIYDFVPGKNIPTFGNCSKRCGTCSPNTPDPWIPLLQTVNLWQPVPLLCEGSVLACKEGGIINIIYGGQSAISMANQRRPGGMCVALPPGAAQGSNGGGASACGAAASGAEACGTAADACGAAASGASACGAAASACGAAASGASACGAAASACGAAASGASACGAAASACGAAASGASACGAQAAGCGAQAAGASACGAQVGGCAADACGADACGIDLTVVDACAADACAIDIIPGIPLI